MKKPIRSGSPNEIRNKEDISPVPAKAVTPPPENEDNKSGLTCRRRLFLKKAQMVTGERRAKGRALLEALERPGISQLQVREFLELADENGQVRPAPSKQSDKPFFIPESPL